MYRQETINPYDRAGDKGKLVEEMFDNIAPTYDTLNHRLSWDIDKEWRQKAIRLLLPYQPKHILDIATGTGDFAIMAAKLLQPQSIVGTDISEGMMSIGRQKVEQEGMSDIVQFQKEDCMKLSFENDAFDAVTAAFGIRNFSHLEQGLREMVRVLKPGGHLSIIELTSPQAFPMKQLFKIYSHTILPFYGRIVSKDQNAYRYLTATIEAFPQGEQMQEILYRIGLSKVSFKRLTFGICTMYFGEK